MASQPVFFSTQTRYGLPSSKFMIPVDFKRYQLSQLLNKALSLPKPIPFDFLVRGQLLGSRSLREWCTENNLGEEETLDVEYVESILPPQKVSDFEHEDWVSSVSCQLKGHFVTASYDGHVRAFDFSKNLVLDTAVHASPITCVTFLSDTPSLDDFTMATASQDMTACLTQVQRPTEDSPTFQVTPQASLHLHTGPVSSIASNPSGSHLLTASWDSLIGLWDNTIPETDEVPESIVRHGNKRRKVESKLDERGKCKAPINVFKSHTSRVSKAVFMGNGEKAVSCGFDSSVRIWDIEMGLCSRSIMAAEKPFLDLALSADENMVIAASTDRIVVAYDMRSPETSVILNSVSLLHPATPSCLCTSKDPFKVISGSYDGIARVWDLRNTKGTAASFKVWDDKKKILSVDWDGGMVGVGGEGGLEVWKIPESIS